MQKPSGFSTRAVLAVGLISLQYMNPQPSHAACVLTPGTGNDTYTCNNGSSAGLTDLSGDNSLTLSTGGAINGDVTFGPGIDTVEIRDGRVTGIVQQGDGVCGAWGSSRGSSPACPPITLDGACSRS